MKNEENKESQIKILMVRMMAITIVIALLGGLWVGSYKSSNTTKKNYDCYISHVQECFRCHQDNLTYSLCSGFCFSPLESDLNNTNSLAKACIIHPLENCWDLPRECNL